MTSTSYRSAWNSYRGACLSALLILSLACAAGRARSAEHDIYPAPDRAGADLDAALAAAGPTHKRIILDFGGNWCADCHVLDHYFHDATNGPLLEGHFILVHINIGRMNENLGLADHYRIPLRKGVPALAVLDEHGGLLFSQRTGEFEAMRSMQSSAVTDFLLYWRSRA